MIDQSKGFSPSSAARLVQFRWLLAVVGCLVLAATYPASRRLEFNRSIGAMFNPTDPTFVDYQELQDSFGGNAVVILVYRDAGLRSAGGLERNRKIADRVEAVDGVQGVLSAALLNDAVKKFMPTSLLPSALSITAAPQETAPQLPELFRSEDPVASGFDALFSGYTHSKDYSRGAVAAMLVPNHPPETIESLKRIAAGLAEDFGTNGNGQPIIHSAAIVGEPVLVHDGFSLIERDGAKLATYTIVLLSVVVIVCLADVRFVLLTIAVILWSVVVTRATMVWIGIHLSLVSTILTAIVTVIAVTAVLHLGVRFRVARNRRYGAQQSAVRAFCLLLVPIGWTCATDAAGFAALNASGILPIRQFGLMIAIAASAVFVAVMLFAPALMTLPSLGIGNHAKSLQDGLARWLHRTSLQVATRCIARPKTCLAIAIIATAISLVGIGRARTETSFLNNFRSSSPVVRAYSEVESRFGGAGVWDIVLDAPPEITGEYLEQVRALEDELRGIDIDGTKLNKVLSLADAEEIASRAPLSTVFSPASRLSAMYLVMPVFFDALLTGNESGQRKLRIMLRSYEQLESEPKTALIEKVEELVRRRTSSERWKEIVARGGGQEAVADGGRVTGYYVVMARLIGQLVGDQWRCFLASGLLVWGLLIVATRSLRLATAALVPNLLPIFVVLAAVGWWGGTINMGAAMIAAVSIGLSIDGSVHFLASYQRSRARKHGARVSAAHAAGSIGVPVLLATVALVVGFGVLGTSEFVPTATFGTLVAATLTMGTAVNLTLLPAIVAWIEK